ncbi:MAG: hypothetical protein ACI8QY_000221 [bacterium]|jgi:hypothetical protein
MFQPKHPVCEHDRGGSGYTPSTGIAPKTEREKSLFP